jgi:16S rRNA (cytidine1402-2'-O)-methyltransferase
MAAGKLILAGTPIGNSGDATPRLLEVLATADVIAAEDTRKLHALAQRLGVKIGGKVISCHEHNETSRITELLAALADGQTVLLVTDAGMPAVSDPGYRLVAAAASDGYFITCIPGPSAVTTAIALSGLASDRFAFEGFLPRKTGERERLLESLRSESRTMVFFEAPHRIQEMVGSVGKVLGVDRSAALCRELTKVYEEVWRGTLAQLSARLEARAQEPVGIRGEFVVVVAGAKPQVAALPDLVPEVRRRRADAGASLKEAAAAIAAEYNVSKRELYNLALREG